MSADLAAKVGVAHLVYSSLHGVGAGSGIDGKDVRLLQLPPRPSTCPPCARLSPIC